MAQVVLAGTERGCLETGMNYNNPIPQNIANRIKLACGCLFALFCFLYLFCLQNDVLAEAQYVFSNGVTRYSRFFGAVIITFALMCVQYLVDKVARLSGRWYAMTYLPSFVLLMMITSLSRRTIEHFTFGSWIWILPLFVVVYVLVLRLRYKMPGESIQEGDYTTSRYLWPNFLTLLIMILLCGANAPANDVYMYELKAERLILDGDYEGAGEVGQRSLVTSRRLNELRMYALAKEGELGEKLFDYPQPYGAEALLMLDDTITRLHRFTSKDIQEDLGAWANDAVTSLDSYLNLLRNNAATRHNPLLPEYVLCSKLLEKDMSGFYRSVRQYYHISDPSDVLKLPKAYREAILLQAQSISRDSLQSFADTLMLAQYEEYMAVQEADTAETIKQSILRRDFGNTLWWYIDKD